MPEILYLDVLGEKIEYDRNTQTYTENGTLKLEQMLQARKNIQNESWEYGGVDTHSHNFNEYMSNIESEIDIIVTELMANEHQLGLNKKTVSNLEYFAEFDDSVSVIEDEEPTPYGKQITFNAHDDLSQYFLNKIYGKYGVRVKIEDVIHFEFYETGNKEDAPLVSALLNKAFVYNEKSYVNFDFDLSKDEQVLLKKMLEEDIERQIDREAMAELDRKEALFGADGNKAFGNADDFEEKPLYNSLLFNHYNEAARCRFIEMIESKIADTHSWSLSALEDIYGRTIIEGNPSTLTDEQLADLDDGSILYSQAVSLDSLDEVLEGEDVMSLREYAEGLDCDISMVDIPHKIVVFTKDMPYADMQDEHKWVKENVKEYTVARDTYEMVSKIKELQKENEGLYFMVGNGAGIVHAGTVNDKNLSIVKGYLENLNTYPNTRKEAIERD